MGQLEDFQMGESGNTLEDCFDQVPSGESAGGGVFGTPVKGVGRSAAAGRSGASGCSTD